MDSTHAAAARHMARQALKAALATRDAETGAPYASMVLLATAVDGAPLTLISRLARHTRNLIADPAASILVDTSNTAGDPASGGRVSLMGQFSPTLAGPERSRFLARHPAAAEYADFADFGFWRLEVGAAHLIEGFGRISSLAGNVMRPPSSGLAEFTTEEPDVRAKLQRQWPAVCGLDPEGVDLRENGHVHRLTFGSVADTIEAAHAAAIAGLAKYCAAQSK